MSVCVCVCVCACSVRDDLTIIMVAVSLEISSISFTARSLRGALCRNIDVSRIHHMRAVNDIPRQQTPLSVWPSNVLLGQAC